MALGWLTPDLVLESFQPSGLAAGPLPPAVHPVESVEHLMAADVTAVLPTATLAECWKLMRSRAFRHLPVLDRGRLVGVLSDRDILRFVHRGSLAETAAREAMTTRLWTATRTTSILEAARLMADHRIGCLPVVDDSGRLEGILSASDVVRCLSFHAPVQAWL